MARSRASSRGAVAAHGNELQAKRAVRRRKVGDGQGVDISIAGGYFGTGLEGHLEKLSKAAKKKLLDHVQLHVDEALKPMVKLVTAKGTDIELELLKSVGPNLFRTIIEYLEDETEE
jgi:hypothetical protein